MKHWLIGSVAAVAVLTACGGGDKADAPVEVGDVSLTKLQLSGGDASEAGDALAALSLTASGDGRVSFAGSSTDGADATFNDVSISVEDGESPVTAGMLTFKGLDMTEEGANFAQMTLSNISIAPDGEDDGTVAISQIQLTNPSPELGAWVASLMGQGDPAPFPALDKLSFDGLSLGDMSIDASNIDELDVFTIGAIDVRELSSKGLGAMVIEGMNVSASDSGEAIKFSIGSMAMSGLSETMMQVFAKGVASGADGADPDEFIEEIMSLVATNPGDPGYDSFTMDALDFDAAGVAFDIPSMKASVTRDNQGRATRSVTEPFNMTLKADPEGELGSQLAGPLGLMGYDELKMSGQSDVAMDPDADTITYASGRNYLALEDGFKMSFGGSFTGLADYYKAIAESGGDDEAVLAGLAAMSMNGFDLSFEDNSIVERGFTAAAAMTGQDAEGLRVQATAGVAALPLLAGQAGVDPGLAAELGGALSKFLDQSGTLSLKFEPGTPLTAADFEDPSALTKDRLGFSAETN